MMAEISPWQILRHGEYEEALRAMRKMHARTGKTSHAIELGVAYLWLGRYDAAWDHFDAENQKTPKKYDIFYKMAGTAKWCLEERNRAVAEWRTGCRCQYMDGAGGVGPPLLLFAASVIDPKSFSRFEAEKLLEQRVDKPGIRASIKNWPGPIAEYIMRRIDDGELAGKCIGSHEGDTFMRHWLADFYRGVAALAHGNVACFLEVAARVSTTSDDDFDLSKKYYLGKFWNAEFFIARHEVTRRGPLQACPAVPIDG